MADNITVTPGSGATIAADEITIDGASALVQRVKLVTGVAGSGQDALVGAGTESGVLRVTLPTDGTGVVKIGAGSAVIGSVGLSAGENFAGLVGGVIVKPSANFTRPSDTTAYAVGDLVANSTTAGSVTPMSFTVARVSGGNGSIRRARLRKSGTGLTNALFRLHLYNATISTITNGDNGVFSTSGVANYMGAIDISVDRAFTDGASGNGVPNIGSEINFALASGQAIYGLLEARGAYTPASGEVFTVHLEVFQN